MRVRIASSLLVLLSVVAWPPPVDADPLPIVVQPPPNVNFWVMGATSSRNPENLTATEVAASAWISLTWDRPYDTDGHTLLSYMVYRIEPVNALDPVAHFSTEPSTTSFTDETAVAGSHYIYFVTAIYEGGNPLSSTTESIPSNIVIGRGGYPPCTPVVYYTRWPFIDVYAECLMPP